MLSGAQAEAYATKQHPYPLFFLLLKANGRLL